MLFDHWGEDTVNSKVIYFAFQYLWPALVAVYQATKGENVIAYLLIAAIFAFITANELTYFGTDAKTYDMMISSPPAYALTLIALILFVIYTIVMRWKKRSA
jgi:drug/metabolite transporter (DMT)-like permease